MWKTVICYYLHLFKKNKRYESNQKINANKKLTQAACCKTLGVLVPFVTSHLCKAGFSAAAVIKSKYRCVLQYQTLHRGLIKCA